MLHAVLSQVIDVVASLVEELQIESLLVCVELLIRLLCHFCSLYLFASVLKKPPSSQSRQANEEAPIIETWRLLLPQWFILPSTGEAHHGRLHTGIFFQKRFEILNKRVLGIDAIEPVGNAAKLRIEAVDREIEIGYPPLAHP